MAQNFFTFPIQVLKSIQNFAQTRQKDLEKKIKDLDKEDPFKNTDRVNFNSDDEDAKEQIDHDRVKAIRDELEKNLMETKKALEKIKKGKYGFCESCGKLIDTDRLSVNPLAPYCLNCEKKRSNKI